MKYKKIKILIIAVILFLNSNIVFAVSVLDDNFDSYSLGSLNSQGSWVSDPSVVIQTSEKVSVPNGVEFPGSNSWNSMNKTFPITETGFVSFRYKFVSNVINNDWRWNVSDPGAGGDRLWSLFKDNGNGSHDIVGIDNVVSVANISNDVWHVFSYSFNCSSDLFDLKVDGVGVDNGIISYGCVNPNQSWIVRYSGTPHFYIDDIGAVFSFPVTETCSDGIQNQDETFIDIGGVCSNPLLNDSQLTIYSDLSSTPLFSPIAITGGFVQQSGGYDNVLLYFSNNNEPSLSFTHLVPISTDYNLAGNWNTSVSVPNGSWNLVARLYNSVNYTFGNWYPSENSLSIPFVVGQVSPTANCDTLDLGCYISSAFIYLFKPSFTISQFQNIWSDMQVRFPFNYIDYIQNIWSDFQSGSGVTNSLSFSIGSSSIVVFSSDLISNSPVAPLVRGFISTLLWFFLLFAVYKRVVNLFNINSPTS